MSAQPGSADKTPPHKPLKCAVGLLKADPQNPRTIEAPALRGLGVSMETFGDLSGIVWNERSGNLVAGHQRMNRLKAAGADHWTRISKTEGFIIHPKTKERFGIRIADWDETTERMANLTANNTEIQGDFTEEAAEQLRALEEDDRFQDLMLHELQADLDKEVAKVADAAAEPGEDDAPEPPAKPITRSGDLWLLGQHRLLCGDSTKAEDVARLLDAEKPALGLHDPPYGIDIQHARGNVGGMTKEQWAPGLTGHSIVAANAYPRIAGDDRPFDPGHLLRSGAVVVLWGANHYADKLPPSAAWLAWDKRGDMPGNDFSDAELAWVSKGGAVRMFRHLWSGLIRDGKDEDGPKRCHPTQKPVALYRWIVEQHTEKGHLVYDAYAGSGPTVLACEKLGRRARVMELAPAYCDVIVSRWEKLTGKKATREKAAPPAPAAAR